MFLECFDTVALFGGRKRTQPWQNRKSIPPNYPNNLLFTGLTWTKSGKVDQLASLVASLFNAWLGGPTLGLHNIVCFHRAFCLVHYRLLCY